MASIRPDDACLDDTAAVALIEGLTSETELESIETHLDRCAECRLQVSLMVRVRGSEPRGLDEARPAFGVALGRYQLRRVLGIGAMGVVYAAYDGQLKREIALKLVRSGGNRDRLLIEAQAMARLRDPHVVTVHDVGTEGDHVYVAMELVQGSTLGEWARQPHTPEQILQVLVRAGRGLAAAHDAGLVHRDFKPDNVLVGDDGRVCVTDFGLARSTEATEVEHRSSGAFARSSAIEAEGVALTRTGVVLGTPAYMAPEQLRAEPATAASDQFSFCVSAYEALCGRRPFSGTTVADLLDATTHTRWATPRPKLPRAVQRVIDRGLSADPQARHPSMTALLDALSTRHRARRRFALAAAVVAAGAAGIVIARWAAAPSVPECTRIDETWSVAARSQLRNGLLSSGVPAAELTARVVDGAIDRYAAGWQRQQDEVCAEDPVAVAARQACLDDRRRELAAWLAAYQAPDRAAAERALEAAEALEPVAPCRNPRAVPSTINPIAVAAFDRELAELVAALAAGRYVDVRARTETAVATARALGDRLREARALLVRGQVLLEGGDAAAAEPALFAAFTAASEVGDDYLAARAGLQQIYAYGWRMTRVDDARRWAELTRAIVVRLGDDGLAAALDSSESHLLVMQGRYAEAIERAERALAIHQRMFGDDSYAVVRDLTNLGTAHLEADQLDRAGVVLERARVLGEALLGTAHPKIAITYQGLGGVAGRRGRYQEARQWYERALAVRRATLPADHPSIAECLGEIANLLSASTQPGDALPFIKEAIAIAERRLSANHPQLAMWLCVQGETHRALGQLDEALASYRRAERITATLPNQELHGIPLLGLGEVELTAGRPAAALPILERAVAIFDRDPPTNLNGLATARFSLAKTLWALSRDADARRIAELARADFVRAALGPEDDSLASVERWLRDHTRR